MDANRPTNVPGPSSFSVDNQTVSGYTVDDGGAMDLRVSQNGRWCERNAETQPSHYTLGDANLSSSVADCWTSGPPLSQTHLISTVEKNSHTVHRPDRNRHSALRELFQIFNLSQHENGEAGRETTTVTEQHEPGEGRRLLGDASHPAGSALSLTGQNGNPNEGTDKNSEASAPQNSSQQGMTTCLQYEASYPKHETAFTGGPLKSNPFWATARNDKDASREVRVAGQTQQTVSMSSCSSFPVKDTNPESRQSSWHSYGNSSTHVTHTPFAHREESSSYRSTSGHQPDNGSHRGSDVGRRATVFPCPISRPDSSRHTVDEPCPDPKHMRGPYTQECGMRPSLHPRNANVRFLTSKPNSDDKMTSCGHVRDRAVPCEPHLEDRLLVYDASLRGKDAMHEPYLCDRCGLNTQNPSNRSATCEMHLSDRQRLHGTHYSTDPAQSEQHPTDESEPQEANLNGTFVQHRLHRNAKPELAKQHQNGTVLQEPGDKPKEHLTDMNEDHQNDKSVPQEQHLNDEQTFHPTHSMKNVQAVLPRQTVLSEPQTNSTPTHREPIYVKNRHAECELLRGNNPVADDKNLAGGSVECGAHPPSTSTSSCEDYLHGKQHPVGNMDTCNTPPATANGETRFREKQPRDDHPFPEMIARGASVLCPQYSSNSPAFCGPYSSDKNAFFYQRFADSSSFEGQNLRGKTALFASDPSDMPVLSGSVPNEKPVLHGSHPRPVLYLSNSGDRPVLYIPNPNARPALYGPNPNDRPILPGPNPSDGPVLCGPNPSDRPVLYGANSNNRFLSNEPNQNDWPFSHRPTPSDRMVLHGPNPNDRTILNGPNPHGIPVLYAPNLRDQTTLYGPHFSDRTALYGPNPNENPVSHMSNATARPVLYLTNSNGRPVLPGPNPSDRPVLYRSSPIHRTGLYGLNPIDKVSLYDLHFGRKPVLSETHLHDRPAMCPPQVRDRPGACESHHLSWAPALTEPRLSARPFLCNMCCSNYSTVEELDWHRLTHARNEKNPVGGDNTERTQQFTRVAENGSEPQTGGIPAMNICTDCNSFFPSRPSLIAHKCVQERRAASGNPEASTGSETENMRRSKRLRQTLPETETAPDTTRSGNAVETEGSHCVQTSREDGNYVQGKAGSKRIKIPTRTTTKRGARKSGRKKPTPRSDGRRATTTTTTTTSTNKRRFKCQDCGAAFSYSTHLKIHGRVHTGERPCVCVECGASFMESSSLKRHRRKHWREKPYICISCNTGYADSSSLRRHLLKHAPEPEPLNE